MIHRIRRHHESGTFLAVALTAACMPLGCFPAADDPGSEPGVKAAATSQASPAAEALSGQVAGAAEASDLDQTVDQLLAAKCEHGVLQYTCDECRYEVGTVKVDLSLFREGGPLDTLLVADRSFSRNLEVDGEVQLDESKSVALRLRASGVVRTIAVDLGNRVQPHQILCRLDCPEYSETKAMYLGAGAALRLARATMDRESELYAQKICPQKELLEAQAALQAAVAEERAAFERLRSFGLSDADVKALEETPSDAEAGRLPVYAPIAGTVLERSLSAGSTVEPGTTLFLIGDTSTMWVLTNLYERDLARVMEGASRGEVRAEVEVSAHPGHLFPGRLDRLQGTLDPVSRTAKGRIVVDNSAGWLRAGMFARVRLYLEPGRPAKAVPDAAVLEDGGRSFVFLRTVLPYFVRRPVLTGTSAGGWTEIVRGLSGGEVAVTRGAFLLKSDVLRSKMGAGCAD